MSLPIESRFASTPKSLERHTARSQRRIQIARARHHGLVLVRLEREERAVLRDWTELDGVQDPCARADARAKLSKVLDTIRERRRILLGEPLPGSRRAGSERKPILHAQVLDVEPTPAGLPAISVSAPSEPTPGA